MTGRDNQSAASRHDVLQAAVQQELRRARGPGDSGVDARVSERTADRRAGRLLQERRDANYHQARILLLIDAFAGRTGSMDGLTKLAKLDFLLRYPAFLERLADSVEGLDLGEESRPTAQEREAVG